MSDPRPNPRYVHHTLDLDWSTVHYVEAPSDGLPTLFVHGMGADWSVWQGITRRLFPALHPYYVDLRGHGGSAHPPTGYRIEDYAADVAGLLDHLRPMPLVGSSLGAITGIVVAATRPELVTRLVLVDPPLGHEGGRRPAFFRELLRLKREDPAGIPDHLQRLFPRASRLQLDALTRLWANVADGVLEAAIAGEPGYFNVMGYLDKVACPTLLMRADPAERGVLTEAEAAAAFAHLEHGRERFFPGAGHAIHATAPAEFARELLEFLGAA